MSVKKYDVQNGLRSKLQSDGANRASSNPRKSMTDWIEGASQEVGDIVGNLAVTPTDDNEKK